MLLNQGVPPPLRVDPVHRRDSIAGERRAALRRLAGSTLLFAGAGLGARSVLANPAFSKYPFVLGVASGDPSADGCVLWTKLAPAPLERGAGMPKRPVEVTWSVARDERLRAIVRSGKTIAYPELGHAVHVEVTGLDSAREYFYQFAAGDALSSIGRTKTLPGPGAALSELRFAVAGCQRYEDGFYTAYRHLAAERLDFVFHYGDYIYERRVMRPGDRAFPVVRVMPGDPDECYSLDDYRHRYALHQMDPDLQAAHASAPFVMSFDDHEVDSNWAGDISEEKTPTELFLMRRAAAFQAWYEHLPLRRAQAPRGPDIAAYRRLDAGDLLAMSVLDTRQYRSVQACGGGTKPVCPEALDPARTMLGSRQEQWLYAAMHGSRARWNLLAQQVPVMRADRDPDPNVFTPSMDKWDGYVAARDRLFNAVEQARLANLVVVTGDVHYNCAGELKKDFANERSPALGVEFIATSITSLGDGFDVNARFKAFLAQDPHIRFLNGQRGYVRHVVTPERWRADYRVVDKVSSPDGRIATRRSFVVDSGRSALLDA